MIMTISWQDLDKNLLRSCHDCQPGWPSHATDNFGAIASFVANNHYRSHLGHVMDIFYELSHHTVSIIFFAERNLHSK